MNTVTRVDAAVIGAGPAGLSCAVRLVDSGRSVAVFEAGSAPGGLARSLPMFGQTVDLGPHRFFSADRIVVDHWKRFAGADPTLVHRLTRIRYENRFFRYPIEPLDALKNLDWLDAAAALASYARERVRVRPEPRTFEDWVVSRFGRRLFDMFFRTYTEKVWGIPCSRIDADWASQRIRALSLGGVVKAALRPDRGRSHKTLVDQFAYPKGGSGRVYERMTDWVRERGGRVELSSPVRRVLLDGDGGARGVELANGAIVEAGSVVSTMPLTTLVTGLPDAPAEVRAAAGKLRFRNTILVYVEVDGPNPFPDNWIYVHDPDVRHGRITNFRNWCPSLVGDATTTVLCLEYWCFDDDDLWSWSDEKLASLARSELERSGLVPRGATRRTQVLRLRRSYPVYEIGYREQVELLRDYLRTIPRLLAIGRYGAFKYNNQDHSILMGLLAATQIITGRDQDLWAVNSDSAYQESAEVRGLFPDAR